MRPLRRSRTENSCRGSPQKELTVQGLSDYESNIEMGTVASGGAGTLMGTREQGKPEVPPFAVPIGVRVSG